ELFIMMIRNYLKENPVIRTATDSPGVVSDSEVWPQEKKKRGGTAEETYALFRKGMSLDDIALHRKLAPSTIALHLEQLIRSGRDIDIDRLADKAKKDEIAVFFRSSGQWTLRPVIEHFNGRVTYEEARIVRAWLQGRR
ncbi:MAG: helix-turn-helix domain-containing protein, partial [Nitrospirota bacterium]|nr:helix-turn-helix domain-containing protein [Nitrospirota bacterium]